MRVRWEKPRHSNFPTTCLSVACRSAVSGLWEKPLGGAEPCQEKLSAPGFLCNKSLRFRWPKVAVSDFCNVRPEPWCCSETQEKGGEGWQHEGGLVGKVLGGTSPANLTGGGPFSVPRRTRRNKEAPLSASLWPPHATHPPTEQTRHLYKKHIGHIYWCMCFLQKCWKEEPAFCPACWPAGRPGAGAQRLPVLREAAGECAGAAGPPQARSPLQPGPHSAGPRRVAEPAGWITPWRWRRAFPPRWCRNRRW